MAKAYVVITEAIKDPDGMAAYARAAGPSIAQGGAKVLAAGPAAQVLEGSWHGDQTIILEFDSVEAARAWYDSEAYAQAKPLRHAAADSNAVILAGFDAPPRRA